MYFKIFKMGSRFRLIAFKSMQGSVNKKSQGFFTSHEKNLALAKKFDSQDLFWELEEQDECNRLMDIELFKGRFQNNISRAKSRVRELALCNDWEWFFTLTVAPDKGIRYSLPDVQRKVSDTVANFNKRYSCSMKYLFVPEQHKDCAWHVHGLLFGVPLKAVETSPANRHYFHLPYFLNAIGFNSVDRIKDHNRCASYITKYISKDMTGQQLEKGRRLFWASRGLSGKELFFSGETSQEQVFDFENDFVFVKEFDEDKLSEIFDNL